MRIGSGLRVLALTALMAGCHSAPSAVCYRLPKGASLEQAAGQICGTDHPSDAQAAAVRQGAEHYLQAAGASNISMSSLAAEDPRGRASVLENDTMVCFLPEDANRICSSSTPELISTPAQDAGIPSQDGATPPQDGGVATTGDAATPSLEVRQDGGEPDAGRVEDAGRRPIKNRPIRTPRADAGPTSYIP